MIRTAIGSDMSPDLIPGVQKLDREGGILG